MDEKRENKNIVYLSLGSNIGEREKHLAKAIKLLRDEENITVLSKSAIYETDPVGYENQQPFLNMVVKISTSLRPMQLLEKIQHIEKQGGRKRNIRWGPRTIDLDIMMKQLNWKHCKFPIRACFNAVLF